MTTGLSHHHLDESIFMEKSGNFYFNSANRIAPDGTPRFAASYLWLFCLPINHKKDARLIWVNLLVVCY